MLVSSRALPDNSLQPLKEATRLIRLSLIVQIALAFFAMASDVLASSAEMSLAGAAATELTRTVITIDVIATLPVIVLFAATLAPRTMSTRRNVQAVLALMIICFAWQINLPALVGIRLAAANPGVGVPLYELVVSGASPASLVSGPIGELLLFALLPAVIGAWLGGRRSAIGWAFFTSLCIAVSVLLVWQITPADLRGDERVIDAVVLLLGQGLVIGMVCYFVGVLADQQRAEQAQVEQANAQLAEANRQLAAQASIREQLAASRERMQLARELHDTLAHTLAGLAVHLDAVTAIVDPQATEVKAELSRASELAHNGLDAARNAIVGLRSDVVSELGLKQAIQRQLDLVERRANVQGELAIEGGEPNLAPADAQSLFGIAQEALNNVERHANAQHVQVVLATRRLRISDDGIGFDDARPQNGRYGLRGMRERATSMRARLHIVSRAGHGTIIEVTW